MELERPKAVKASSERQQDGAGPGLSPPAGRRWGGALTRSRFGLWGRFCEANVCDGLKQMNVCVQDPTADLLLILRSCLQTGMWNKELNLGPRIDS